MIGRQDRAGHLRSEGEIQDGLGQQLFLLPSAHVDRIPQEGELRVGKRPNAMDPLREAVTKIGRRVEHAPLPLRHRTNPCSALGTAKPTLSLHRCANPADGLDAGIVN